jgi:hypothetical protein
LTSGKADASLLKQFGIRKLAPRRVLATDHADKPEVGSDESLPSLLPLVLESSQFLLGRIGKTGTGGPCLARQQAGLDCAL